MAQAWEKGIEVRIERHLQLDRPVGLHAYRFLSDLGIDFAAFAASG
jgi:hypothetical protein